MSSFKKRYHRPGTPPGTLTSATSSDRSQLRVVAFNADDIRQQVGARFDDLNVAESNTHTTWIHVEGGISAALLSEFSRRFGFHDLALEDVVNTGQRPKLDEFEDHLFVILTVPWLDAGRRVSTSQFSAFVAPGVVVTFVDAHPELFEPIFRRLENSTSRLREGDATFLFYALLDVVVDHAFPILEQLDDEITGIEEDLLRASGTNDVLPKLHRVRRSLLMLRKIVWPQREVIRRLLADDTPLSNGALSMYLKDCDDHTAQMIDLVETYREMVASLHELHLSNESKRLNETMRLLTVIATIFIPLTFIVGIYGMNFGDPGNGWAMPELRWKFGYPFIWLLMIAITAGMIAFFRRKRWL